MDLRSKTEIVQEIVVLHVCYPSGKIALERLQPGTIVIHRKGCRNYLNPLVALENPGRNRVQVK